MPCLSFSIAVLLFPRLAEVFQWKLDLAALNLKFEMIADCFELVADYFESMISLLDGCEAI